MEITYYIGIAFLMGVLATLFILWIAELGRKSNKEYKKYCEKEHN